MTRIVVIDDQQLIRHGLTMVLGTLPGIEVVGEAGDGREGLAVVNATAPDVVLCDARMPVMDGMEFVRACGDKHPELPVIILTTFDQEDVVLGSLGAGAAGFLLKDIPTERLGEAIGAVQRGEMVLDPRVTRTAMRGRAAREEAEDTLAVLTRTERVVARHLSTGMTNAEIAEALVVAEGTVKNHVSSLLHKLEARDRTALALLLYRAFHEVRSGCSASGE